MTKSHVRVCEFRGEITAFLALVFLLMLSVVAALVESASIYAQKHGNRARAMMALESVFAEYDVGLLEEYEIFARFGASLSLLTNRLAFYGAGNLTYEIEQIEYLSDDSGRPFFVQAVQYAKNWLGLDGVMLGEEYEFSGGSEVEDEEKGILQSIRDFLFEEDATLPTENNPIQTIQNLKSQNVLSLVAPKNTSISKSNITLKDLASHRQLTEGNYSSSSDVGTLDKSFFIAYLAEHFSYYGAEEQERSLAYECEYLIGGKKSDRENLEAVCGRILQIRLLANYGYLLTDTVKKLEAGALALELCTLAGVLPLADLVKHAILLAWAYGESIVDVRVLLKGGKSPFVKTKDTWQLQLVNLIKLGTANEVTGEKNTGSGLSYQSYLYGLLLLEKSETLSIRSLDLVECHLNVKVDQCMTKVKLKATSELREGVVDQFTTQFGYQ